MKITNEAIHKAVYSYDEKRIASLHEIATLTLENVVKHRHSPEVFKRVFEEEEKLIKAKRITSLKAYMLMTRKREIALSRSMKRLIWAIVVTKNVSMFFSPLDALAARAINAPAS